MVVRPTRSMQSHARRSVPRRSSSASSRARALRELEANVYSSRTSRSVSPCGGVASIEEPRAPGHNCLLFDVVRRNGGRGPHCVGCSRSSTTRYDRWPWRRGKMRNGDRTRSPRGARRVSGRCLACRTRCYCRELRRSGRRCRCSSSVTPQSGLSTLESVIEWARRRAALLMVTTTASTCGTRPRTGGCHLFPMSDRHGRCHEPRTTRNRRRTGPSAQLARP